MRVLRQVVEKQLNIRSSALHDYGAGMCGKAASLASMNGCDTWTPYGVLPEAIEQCTARFSHEPAEFAMSLRFDDLGVLTLAFSTLSFLGR